MLPYVSIGSAIKANQTTYLYGYTSMLDPARRPPPAQQHLPQAPDVDTLPPNLTSIRSHSRRYQTISRHLRHCVRHQWPDSGLYPSHTSASCRVYRPCRHRDPFRTLLRGRAIYGSACVPSYSALRERLRRFPEHPRYSRSRWVFHIVERPVTAITPRILDVALTVMDGIGVRAPR